MSILLVEVLPQGIIFGADRNVTFSKWQVLEGGNTVIQYLGQSHYGLTCGPS